MKPFWRVGPGVRVALGLVGLSVSLLLVMDLLLGVIANPAEAQRQLRRQVADNLAVQLAVLVQSGHEKTLGTVLNELVARKKEVRSMAVRQANGNLVVQSADHRRLWLASADPASHVDQLLVPLHASAGHWGDVEIVFAPSRPRSLVDWLKLPTIFVLLVLPVCTFVLFHLYLRRALQHLDPSTAVPDRVRKAFDALTDAVLVIDPQGRVMLANRAFRGLHPDADGELNGRCVADFAWLGSAGAGEAPWTRTLRDGATVTGQPLAIEQPQGSAVHTIVSCAPILDAGGRARGCLVTLDDVTQIHSTNDELRRTLLALEQSREEIKLQNAELYQLATRDPLTGCFNRRALFEQGAALLAAESVEGLCCIMTDIDHFKRFNDEFGHAVGDQVIQVVARTLGRGLRAADVLGRYGGEEFCILLPNTSVVVANEVAQRLRIAIMTHAAASTRRPGLPPIKASFGLASTTQGARDLHQLIERADAALYKSKQAGRNRVTLWHPSGEPVTSEDHVA